MRIVDPTAVPVLTSLVTGVLSSAAGEAGQRAWHALSELIHRTFATGDPTTRALSQVELIAEDPQMVDAMAGVLCQRLSDAARHDPDFAPLLDAWMTDADRVVRAGPGGQDTVTNTVEGNAHVDGPLVQGRDFSGPVNLGRPEGD